MNDQANRIARAIHDPTVTEDNTGFDGFDDPVATFFGALAADPRVSGGVRVAMGLTQVAGGVMAVVTTPGGQVIGTYFIAAGMDEVIAGLRQYNGEEGVRSGRENALDSLTGNQTATNIVLAGTDLVLSFKLSRIPSKSLQKTGGRAWPWGYNSIGDEAAESAYQAIRESTTDVSAIARYTKLSRDRLQQIKDYLFNNSEWTGADGEIAAAWHRLRTGRGTEVDKLLLKHETAEMWLRRVKGLNYEDAHRLANKKFNWHTSSRGD